MLLLKAASEHLSSDICVWLIFLLTVTKCIPAGFMTKQKLKF